MKSLMKPIFAILITAFLVFSACEKAPMDPTQTADQAGAKLASEQGLAIFNTIASADQIGDVMRGPDAKIEFGETQVNNPSAAKRYAAKVLKPNLDMLSSGQFKKSRSIMGDSLVWEVTTVRPILGYTETSRVYYDAETGIAKVENIKFDYGELYRLAYDSTCVFADLNGTFDIEEDDVLQSAYENKLYKEGHHLVQEISSIVFDPYQPGTEPTGATAQSTIIYSETSFIRQTIENANMRGTEGSWSKEVTYSDNSTSYEKVTFSQNGTGTIEERSRDGVVVTATFDDAESDGQGSFTKTTEYPAGSDPVSIYEAGEFQFSAEDSTIHGLLQKETRFADGRVLKESLEIDERHEGSTKITTLKIQEDDGGHGTITVEERLDGAHATANWTEPDGAYIIATVDSYTDGSAQLQLKIYENEEAFNNGETPLLSALFNFNPDASGNGEVTDGENNFDVNFNADGSQTISE